MSLCGRVGGQAIGYSILTSHSCVCLAFQMFPRFPLVDAPFCLVIFVGYPGFGWRNSKMDVDGCDVRFPLFSLTGEVDGPMLCRFHGGGSLLPPFEKAQNVS